MHVLLESHRDHDIIFVQEPYWGFIKNVVNSKDNNKDKGVPYFQTAGHSNFVCLGASEKSRVCTFVHKRLTTQKHKVRNDLVKHKDILLIEITMAISTIRMLNVYNDSRTHAALGYLTNRVEQIPEVHIMTGNFNLHHQMWGGENTLCNNILCCDQLIQLSMDDFGLDLRNPVGEPTWKSNNINLRKHTIDLVWMKRDLKPFNMVTIDLNSRHKGDHAVITWKLKSEFLKSTEKYIKPYSEEETEYQKELASALFNGLPGDARMQRSKELVLEIITRLETIITNQWDTHAKTKKPSRRSKGW